MSTYFLFEKTNPWNFQVSYFNPLEIPSKTKLCPQKSHETVLEPLKIPMQKTKPLGNFTCLFLDHPCKFHFTLIRVPSSFISHRFYLSLSPFTAFSPLHILKYALYKAHQSLQQPLMTSWVSETDSAMLVFTSNFNDFTVYLPHENL